jgi:hypothetical protein
MADYAFKIGEMVDYRSPTRAASAAHGPYQITQRLPPENGEFRYRIKSPNERHERVADESDLSSI